MKKRLTQVQARIVLYVQAFREREGISPSYRELMEAFGWTSTNAVACHLDSLRRKGAITPLRSALHRAIVPTRQGLASAQRIGA